VKELKITIRNLQKKLPIYPARIKKPILKALKNEGVNRGEITVSLVSDKLIAGLNAKYLKENSPTDVLSFDLTASPGLKARGLFGDIIVSVDTALRNSRIYKTSPYHELELYALHGCLHLLGYDDLYDYIQDNITSIPELLPIYDYLKIMVSIFQHP